MDLTKISRSTLVSLARDLQRVDSYAGKSSKPFNVQTDAGILGTTQINDGKVDSRLKVQTEVNNTRFLVLNKEGYDTLQSIQASLNINAPGSNSRDNGYIAEETYEAAIALDRLDGIEDGIIHIENIWHLADSLLKQDKK
jgi:hypothetical protein